MYKRNKNPNLWFVAYVQTNLIYTFPKRSWQEFLYLLTITGNSPGVEKKGSMTETGIILIKQHIDPIYWGSEEFHIMYW